MIDDMEQLYGMVDPPTLSMKEALPDATDWHLQQLLDLFPASPIPFQPMGRLVLVQHRGPRAKIGNIIVPQQVQDTDTFTERMGRVVSLGHLAFWDELSGTRLHGAPWYLPGDFVLLPKFTSNRYVGPGKKSSEEPDVGQAIYRLLNFNEVSARVLSVRDVVV